MCEILTLPRSLRPVKVTVNGEPLFKAFPWRSAANETMGENYDPADAIMNQSISQLLYEFKALIAVAKDNDDTIEELGERFQEQIEQPWMKIIGEA